MIEDTSAYTAARVQTLALAAEMLSEPGRKPDVKKVRAYAEELWNWAIFHTDKVPMDPELPDPAPSPFNDAFVAGWEHWVQERKASGSYPPWEAYAAGFDMGYRWDK